MQHAGILDEKDKLTPAAKKKIIERIKQAGEKGSSSAFNFSCPSLSTPPRPGLVPADLENEKKYEDFHKTIFPNYEKIARGFNLVIQNSILPVPICDPFYLGLKLGVDLKKLPKFSIPDLPKVALPSFLPEFFGLSIPEFSAKLPSLFKIPPPVPPEIPIPKFDIPKIDVNINIPPWLDKYELELWQVKIPKIFLDFVVSININVVIDLALGKPCPLVEKFVKSQAFGPVAPDEQMKLIIAQDMAAFSGECASIAAVGVAVGSAPSPGLTGNMGLTYGYTEPEPEIEEPSPSPPPETIPPDRVSDNGKKFIKALEGFAPIPYPDADGYSVGYGHFIKPGEKKKYPRGVKITLEQAEEQFDSDIKIFEAAINKYIKPPKPLTQYQYDSLASFLYNSGPGKVYKGQYLNKVLNAGNYSLYLTFINGSVKDTTGKFLQGLVNRRKFETALWKTGDYTVRL